MRGSTVLGLLLGCGVTAPAIADSFTVRTVNSATPFSTIDAAETLLAAGPTAGVGSPDVINYAESGAEGFFFSGNLAFPAGTNDNYFAFEAIGVVDILNGSSLSNVVLGVHSDDGFRLRLNGVTVAEWTFPRSSSYTETAPLTLNDGDVLRLTFFEEAGGKAVELYSRQNGNLFLVGDPNGGIDILPPGGAVVPVPAALWGGLALLGGLGITQRLRRRD